MTKAELELRVQELERELQMRVQELEKKLEEASRYKEFKKRNEELTQQLYDKNKSFKTLEQTIQSKDEAFSKINQSYNQLASLFDEYIKGFEDSIETQKLFLRNNLRSQELLNAKIKKFNGSKEGGTE